MSDNELTSLSISECYQYSIDPSLYDHVYLVESGLLRLHRNLPIKEIKKQHSERLKRFKHFATVRSLTLIHLSDEEGLDARSFYSSLPVNTTVCEIFSDFNFPNININYFPIGPRGPFINNLVRRDFKSLILRQSPGVLWVHYGLLDHAKVCINLFDLSTVRIFLFLLWIW